MSSGGNENFQAFNSLPKANIKVKIIKIEKGAETKIDFEITIPSKTPAIGIKLNLLDS